MSLANKIVIGIGLALPSSRWKVWWYRRLGYRIGRRVRIRRGSAIHARAATLGDGVTIEPRVTIVCSELVMGDDAKIDSETTVYGAGKLEMGRGSYIGPRAWINCETLIHLGDDTGVGPGCSVYTHGVWMPYLLGYPRRFEPVILEDNVWVPGNVTILPGVRIGTGTMIGTGSVVLKDVPPESFAAGNPAKVISSMTEVRKALSVEEARARVLESVDAFLAALSDRGWRISRSTDGAYARGARGGIRNRTFVLVVAQDPVARENLDAVLAFSKTGETIVVAIQGISAEAADLLRGAPRIRWFDVPARACGSIREGIASDFRSFLASRYGTRFRVIP